MENEKKINYSSKEIRDLQDEKVKTEREFNSLRENAVQKERKLVQMRESIQVERNKEIFILEKRETL